MRMIQMDQTHWDLWRHMLLHVLIVKRVGSVLFGHHYCLKHTCQTSAELFVHLAPILAISSLWIIMSIIIGMFSVLPTIEIQAVFGLIIIFGSGNITINVNIEDFAVLLLFFWWIRDTHLIGQHLLLYLLDDTGVPSAPPWLDAACSISGGI